MVTNDKLIAPEDVAQQLNVHINTVYHYLTEGKIMAIKIGLQWRIRQSEVDRIIKEGLPLKQVDEPK